MVTGFDYTIGTQTVEEPQEDFDESDTESSADRQRPLADSTSADEFEGTGIEEEFRDLADAWKLETMLISSISEMAMLRPYQRIIGMGWNVVPLILRELQREPDYWFWALQALTGENPVDSSHQGDLHEMAADWLKWGQEHELI